MANIKYSVQVGSETEAHSDARGAMNAYKTVARTGVPCVLWADDVAADVSNGFPAAQSDAARAQLTADLAAIDDA